MTELLTCLPKYKNITYKGFRGNPGASGFKYWVSNRLLTESCKPFPLKKNEKIEENLQKLECKKYCNDGSEILRNKGSFYKKISGEKTMMEDIQTNGPITAGFKVYNDFTDLWHYNRNGIPFLL